MLVEMNNSFSANECVRADTKCPGVSIICQFSARRRAAGQQQQIQQAPRNQELNDSYFSALLKKATAPISLQAAEEDFEFESPPFS